MSKKIEEKWELINNFPNYMVSNFGRLKSITPRKGSRSKVNGGIITGWVKYQNKKPVARMVALREGGETFGKKLHHLILEAFKSERPKDLIGCHNDGDPLNNHIDNLRWDTSKSNTLDSIIHGTKTNPPIHLGESHPNAKLTTEEVRYIRNKKLGRGVMAKLGRELGVSLSTISRVIKMESRINE